MIALLLFGSNYFLHREKTLDPEITRARESEAKSMIGSFNRSQQVFYVENNRFATTISELDVSLIGKYYEQYDIVAESSDFVFTKTQPISAHQELHSFAGAVWFNQEGRSFETKICRSDESYKEITAPEIVTGSILCGSGSSEI